MFDRVSRFLRGCLKSCKIYSKPLSKPLFYEEIGLKHTLTRRKIGVLIFCINSFIKVFQYPSVGNFFGCNLRTAVHEGQISSHKTEKTALSSCQIFTSGFRPPDFATGINGSSISPFVWKSLRRETLLNLI
ncbi:hypothetical protein NIES2100_77260 [Calothrix sp. NIES-2100]|nr:hypothetical protein NIES2100_77260 [Calothrix sp. NIES-2100]